MEPTKQQPTEPQPTQPLRCEWCHATATSKRRGGAPFTEVTFEQHQNRCSKRPRTPTSDTVSDTTATPVSDTTATPVTDTGVRSGVISIKSHTRHRDTGVAPRSLSSSKEDSSGEASKDTGGPGIDLPLEMDRERASIALVAIGESLNSFERSIVRKWVRNKKLLSVAEYETLDGVLSNLNRAFTEFEATNQSEEDRQRIEGEATAQMAEFRALEHERELRRKEILEETRASDDPFMRMEPPKLGKKLRIVGLIVSGDMDDWEREFKYPNGVHTRRAREQRQRELEREAKRDQPTPPTTPVVKRVPVKIIKPLPAEPTPTAPTTETAEAEEKKA